MSYYLIAVIVSWFSFAWIIYVYFLYPLILWIAFNLAKKPVKKGEIEPTVTFFVSAYNEESVIAEKLENVLSLDYPKEKLEVFVVSDCSDDRTDEIVETFADRGVKLYRHHERGGKIGALNGAVPLSTGEVIIMSDSNCMYQLNAIRELVSNFADESIGAVNGEHVFLNKTDSTVERGVGFYWKYETWQKKMESAIHSNAFVTGAMIAVRRELYPFKIENTLNMDNVLPSHIVNSGYRIIYDEDAILSEETASNAEEDFRGRVRTTIRGFWFVSNLGKFLNVFKHPIYTIHLFSRKIMRWLVAPFLILLFVGNVVLCWESINYRVTLLVQIIFYLSAVVGLHYDRKHIKNRYFNIIYFFCLINYAALVRWLAFLRGKKVATWSHATRKF